MEESTYLENSRGCNWGFVRTRFRNEEGVEGDLLLHLRLHFAEYENIVWDGMITTVSGQEGFFVHCYAWTPTETFPEGYYSEIFVPLPAEIAELIPMARLTGIAPKSYKKALETGLFLLLLQGIYGIIPREIHRTRYPHGHPSPHRHLYLLHWPRHP